MTGQSLHQLGREQLLCSEPRRQAGRNVSFLREFAIQDRSLGRAVAFGLDRAAEPFIGRAHLVCTAWLRSYRKEILDSIRQIRPRPDDQQTVFVEELKRRRIPSQLVPASGFEGRPILVVCPMDDHDRSSRQFLPPVVEGAIGGVADAFTANIQEVDRPIRELGEGGVQGRWHDPRKSRIVRLVVCVQRLERTVFARGSV
ncbi:MAG: hypothetical protein K8F58_00760, partial [Bauldia sp.]|nr:hypothetical protein [Bauldia sp.]